jgi:hypothetical protein
MVRTACSNERQNLTYSEHGFDVENEWLLPKVDFAKLGLLLNSDTGIEQSVAPNVLESNSYDSVSNARF